MGYSLWQPKVMQIVVLNDPFTLPPVTNVMGTLQASKRLNSNLGVSF